MFFRSIVDKLVFSTIGVNHFQFCFGRTGNFEDSYIKFPSQSLSLLTRMKGLSRQKPSVCSTSCGGSFGFHFMYFVL